MHQQRPHLRTAAATYAIGVGAAAGASLMKAVRRSTAAALTAAVLLACVLPATADAHAFLASSTPANGSSLARAPKVVSLRFSEAVSPRSRTSRFSTRTAPSGQASGSPRGHPRRIYASRSRTSRQVPTALPTPRSRSSISTRPRERSSSAPARRHHHRRGGVGHPEDEHDRERRTHLRHRLALTAHRGLCAARKRPAGRRARAHLPLLARRPPGAVAGRRRGARGQGLAVPAAPGAPEHRLGPRDPGPRAGDRRGARRARAAATEDRAGAAHSRRARGGGKRPRRIPRHRRDARDRRAHPRRRRLGGRADRARTGHARARAARRARLAAPVRAPGGGHAQSSSSVPGSTAPVRPGGEPRRTALDDLRLVARRQDRASGRHGRPGNARVRRRAAPASVLAAARRRGDRGDRHADRGVADALEPPANGPQFAPSPPTIVGTQLATGNASDLLVDVAATPTGPARTSSRPRFSTTLRPPPAPVRRVSLTFSRGTRSITARATKLDANRWQAGTQLSDPGDWRISVNIDRKGMSRATYATAWKVSSALPAPGARKAQYPQQPLRPILTALAVALALLLAAAGLWRFRHRIGVRRPRTA